MKFLPLALLCALSATTDSAAAVSSKAPFAVRRVQEDGCAGDGDRAQECGATNADRPQNCCEGFVCAGRGSVRCVAEDGADVAATAEEKEDVEEEPMEEEDEPEPEPEPEPVEDDTGCAKVGERSQQCGATNTARPATCCSGLTCSDSASVLCIEDPAASMSDSIGIYQTERYQVGSLQIEGTSFASETDSNTVRINLPAEATARAFVMMYIGDSNGNGERAAYHDNWDHLVDVGENESEDLNVKVQHKVWAGNNDSFRVWDDSDGVNKFVIMPSFLGVDDDAPIVDYATERFTDAESVIAPSVNSVDGGAVLVMYLLDAASADDAIIEGVINDGFRVLSSDLSKSGESMAAFAAESPEGGGCTGPIYATSTGEFASGIAITIALRPSGVAVSDDLEDCTDFVGLPVVTDTPTATPTVGTADQESVTAPTAAEPWFEPTQEPTIADEMDETVEPTAEPTAMEDVIPPTPPPNSAPMVKTATLGAMLICSSLVLSFVF
mmetsp:Transcript_591/g.1243  ORF Transcript_591/g.1243 Transcript_591/m.1243 type:complete len:497 (+) Transcript_591:278-1768(+)